MNRPKFPLSLLGFGVAALLPGLAMLFGAPDVQIFGVMRHPDWPTLSWASLSEDRYAHEATEAFESKFGFRGAATYIDNTLRLKLLGETKPSYGPQRGKEEVLYHSEDLVFFSKYDDQLPSKEEVGAVAHDIGALQRMLAKRGQALVPVLVPGKGALYPAQVSDAWKFPVGEPRPADVRVYDTLRAALADEQVQYVDARALLLSPEHPIERMWGREARHWTHFGGCLTMQRVRDVYTALVGTKLADYPCQLKEHERDGILHDDYDLLRLVNAWNVPMYSPTEPDVFRQWDAPPTPGPSVMTIGTSFFGTLAWDATVSQQFGPVHMNYYNKQMFALPKGEGKSFKAHTDEWRASVHGKQLYILDMFEVYFPGAYLKEFVKELSEEPGPPPAPCCS